MSTMRNCKDIFGYIESKQDILGKPELFARGKLVMLRTCNQLLRRLSKLSISKEFSIRQTRQNMRKKLPIVVLSISTFTNVLEFTGILFQSSMAQYGQSIDDGAVDFL